MAKKSLSHGELIFGIHPIVELLKAKKRKLITIYTTRPEPKSWSLVARLLPSKPVIPIQYVPREVLHKLAGTTDHQGIVAYAQPFVLRKKFFDSQQQSLLIMLDGIQDVHNLGAILRSTYCTGFDGVILCQRQAAPITASVLKSSAGLAEHMDIYVAPSPQAAVQELKKAGYTLYLTFFDGIDATLCEYKKPLCIVIGSEGSGISKEISNAGVHITLPQKTQDISYNASVAAGITLFLVSKYVGRLTR
jgi:23S rRNA (guanosine2251-2'-O)-methyltransferase